MSQTSPAPVHPREVDEDENTSVRAALRSPKRLRTEVLAGLVVASGLPTRTVFVSHLTGAELARLDALLASDVPAFNRLVRERDVPAVTVRPDGDTPD